MAGLIGRDLGVDCLGIESTVAENEAKGKPVRWCADTAALQTLGFEERISLTGGIARTVQWIKSQ